MTLHVSSPAFSAGATIPTKYTCDGQDMAPPLEWSGEPDHTRSIAVICEDPDAPAGTFTHWVLYDVPASTHGIGERTPFGKVGVNDFGTKGFGGPCPPKRDGAHHYHFHVYALDIDSLGPSGLSKRDAMKRMRGHILAEGELLGTYSRTNA